MKQNATEKIIADLVQRIERRFYGKYRGIVIDNADPEQLGRLKVQVPSVLGKDVVTGWALPCLPYGGSENQGFFFIPEVDAGVWVEFEEGDPEFPIWTGTFWSKPKGKNEAPKPNDSEGAEAGEVQDPPTRKIIKTVTGHTLQFEDGDDAGIIIYDGVNGHLVVMNASGISVTDGVNGHNATMNDSGISVSDGLNDHNVVMNESEIKVTDGVNGHNASFNGDGITAKSEKDINLTAVGDITISTSTGKVTIASDAGDVDITAAVNINETAVLINLNA